MTPKYTEWRQRQAEAVRLYTELGWDVETIAWFIGVAPNTVWRYLRQAGTGHVATARRVTVVSPLSRAPYWELHARDGASEVVLGRKFCSGCGRWRHLCDFPWRRCAGRWVPVARCTPCVNASSRYRARRASPEQIELRRERQRFYKGGRQGKSNGHPVVTDKSEHVFLPPEPLRSILDKLDSDNYLALARRSGVTDRGIRRIVNGESRHILLDSADKLAVALGYRLYDLYGDTPTIRDVAHLDEEVKVYD